MKVIDLKKTLKPYYSAKQKKVAFLEIPEMQYLMIDGSGDPNGEQFQQAVAALYSVAYTLKFTLKKGKMQIEYPVMPLEGLWWVGDPTKWMTTPREEWQWTAMILQPDVITKALVDEAKEAAAKKKDLPSLPKLALKKIARRKCCANHARRSVRNRTCHDKNSSRRNRRGRQETRRQTSRDLLRRSAKNGARKIENDFAAGN